MPGRGEQFSNDVRVSSVTDQEILEEAKSKTLHDHAWAFEHDEDTDDDPAVADQVDHEPAVADPIDDDPAVADQVDDPQAPPWSQAAFRPRA